MQFLALLFLALTWPCLAFSQPPPPANQQDAPLTPEAMAVHVLSRLSFGPVPQEVERVRAVGAQSYIEEQLAPEKMTDPPALTQRLAALATVSMDTVQLFRTYGPKAPGGPRTVPTDQEIAQARDKAMLIVREAAEAKLWRILLSPRQLEEVLCDFWYNHFNVPSSKGLARLWVGSFEREAIRPHVLGRFEDLLTAATRHPAMLIHLENWQSSSPDSQMGKTMTQPLVDMHARELLSAHTMGTGAPPKPRDVDALARMLAGWSIGSPRSSQDKNGFVFDERRHDSKEKVFLGQTIKPQGMAEGLEALKLLAAHPDTAKNICGKLARLFLADDPPKALEEKLVKVYQETKGDIRSVLRVLFSSPEFFSSKYAFNRFKNPLRYLAGVVRAAGRPVYEVRSLSELLEWQNMPLYDAPGTSGFKDGREVWMGGDALLKRLVLAAQAGAGALPCWASGTFQELVPLDHLFLMQTLGLSLGSPTSQAVGQAKPEIKAAVLLGGPEAQRY